MSAPPWPLVFGGQWYDGAGSGRVEVQLTLNDDGELQIHNQDSGALIESLPEAQIEVSPRLANSPRYLNLPGGCTVETLENDPVDCWLRHFRPSLLTGLVHRLESRWRFVLLTLLAVVVVVWGTARYGVPAASDAIAAALPAELLDRASEETLTLLDQRWLGPSELSDERQAQLRRHFAEALASHEELRIRVAFRSSEIVGANAFALPNGQIIFTDAMVALAVHDDELLAVLGHEIGHVAHRHSLRRLVQNSLYVFLLAMITGDTSGTAEVVLGLPVLLAELAYSRAYEIEADRYALAFLQQRGIPPHRFADLMRRLDFTHSEETRANKGEAGDDADDTEMEWSDYLSTHPPTAERLKAFD